MTRKGLPHSLEENFGLGFSFLSIFSHFCGSEEHALSIQCQSATSLLLCSPAVHLPVVSYLFETYSVCVCLFSVQEYSYEKRKGICNTKHLVSELILKTTLTQSHFTEEETEALMDPSNRISGLCGQPELGFESKIVSRSKASGSVFGFPIHLGLFLIYLTDACEFQLCTKGSALRREIQGRI